MRGDSDEEGEEDKAPAIIEAEASKPDFSLGDDVSIFPLRVVAWRVSIRNFCRYK